MEKNLKKNIYIYVCVCVCICIYALTESLCCTQKHCKSTTLQLKNYELHYEARLLGRGDVAGLTTKKVNLLLDSSSTLLAPG